MRAVEDHHVDRPGVDAQQCVKLTGTNRSIGSIPVVPGRKPRDRRAGASRQDAKTRHAQRQDPQRGPTNQDTTTSHNSTKPRRRKARATRLQPRASMAWWP
jgi:hypothetical protein